MRFYSHVHLVDGSGRHVHEAISGHLRRLRTGHTITLEDEESRLRRFVVESNTEVRLGRLDGRSRTLCEFIVARECFATVEHTDTDSTATKGN